MERKRGRLICGLLGMLGKDCASMDREGVWDIGRGIRWLHLPFSFYCLY